MVFQERIKEYTVDFNPLNVLLLQEVSDVLRIFSNILDRAYLRK